MIENEYHGHMTLAVVTEASGHVSLGIDEREIVQEDGTATTATVALPRDAEVGFHPLDREIPEVNLALPVPDHVRIVAVTSRLVIDNRWNNLNVQLPVDLLDFHGHEPVQPKQVKGMRPCNVVVFHSNPRPIWHEADRLHAIRQMRIAA